MVLNPPSEHLAGVVALLRYSSSIVVEHPVKSVAPFGIFARAVTQAPKQAERIRCDQWGFDPPHQS
ncbi:hypothetical protein Scep_013001 [Stephania cephalantha]|uniref:Uncharacterized protein n=1 Tax=Stephania cephalantha TaxID=152367 RepID=A0AAP0JI07_9MAGN